MSRIAIPCGLAAAVALALLPGARAQVDPYKTVVVSVPSPYWGYTCNPYGSFLHGVADVNRAQGEFLITQERAKILREKARQAKLETRKAELKHWDWERAFLLEANEKQRERIREAKIRRNRIDPPPTEIWSAEALNVLLDELKRHPSLSEGDSVAVNSDWLPQIHVTLGRAGNIGLLKQEKIPWPVLLRTSDLAGERKHIDEMLARVKKQLSEGEVTAEDLMDLRRRVAALQKRLQKNLKAMADDPAWSPGTYSNAKRFLRQVDEALKMLEQPDAAEYLKPLEGKTVAELVSYMKDKGLRFAPATTGCERHYVALHGALAKESTRLDIASKLPTQNR